jgi:ABC-type uncharacterized transport system involved in gliding motility auxiliary subunit
MQKKSIYSAASIALLVVLFLALSMLSSNLLKGMRLDLTDNKLYTLSEGTRNILDELDEPVNLYLFFSQEASRDLPQIRSYAKRVDEMIAEFASRSGGKLAVHRIDPEPFSEEEDQAAAFGLQAVPVGSGDSLYLGLAGTNALDDVQTMPFLQPSKEKFLEYDLAKMISSLSQPEKRKIGLLSSLPMQAGFDPATQGMREAWVIHEQLSQLFDVENIDAATQAVPQDIDVLVLVHPKDLGQGMLYRLDQFVLGGGRLVAFIDPFAESDRGDPNDPMARMTAGSASSLGPLLQSWGVSFDPEKVVGDLQFGIGTAQSRHIGILSVPGDGMNDGDIVSADLEIVNFSSTGWLSAIENATTKLEPLVQSSENAAPMDASQLRFLSNPADLMNGFNPTGNRYTLAARITGPAKTAFEEAPEGQPSEERLLETDDSGINILLFADTDMLTDRLWVQKQPFLGQSIVSAFADNGSLAINAIDNMLGNRNLISIRTRAVSGRPFDRVDELRLAAERSYRSTEERLQLELTETERKLTDLQAGREDGDLRVLSEEQQQEVQRFMDRKLEIRGELRQVQHNLRRDIDSLGTGLKLVNIVLVPLLVMVGAALFAVRRRKRQDQYLKEKRA